MKCLPLREKSSTLGHLQISLDLVKAERVLLDQRKEASKLRKKLKQTQGYKESRKLLEVQRSRLDKLQRTKAKASRINTRISQMQPSGWKEFLQVSQSAPCMIVRLALSAKQLPEKDLAQVPAYCFILVNCYRVGQVVKVLQAAGALKPDTNELLPLGEVAAAARGVNELWLAVAFTGGLLNNLDPSQLAAACACLVSDGMKARSKEGSSRYIAEIHVNVTTSLMSLSLTCSLSIFCGHLVLSSDVAYITK